jgi:hypothetical protein
VLVQVGEQEAARGAAADAIGLEGDAIHRPVRRDQRLAAVPVDGGDSAPPVGHVQLAARRREDAFRAVQVAADEADLVEAEAMVAAHGASPSARSVALA